MINENKGFLDYAARIYERHYFEFIRKTRYAWCWFEAERESAAMWTIYGNQGVAIRTSAARLRDTLSKSSHSFLYRRMRYVNLHSGMALRFDPERNADSPLLLRPFFLKRIEYASEREVRFVTAGPDQEDAGGLILRNCDPREWISEIRLWPGLTSDEEKAIQKAVGTLLEGVPCARSNLMQLGLPSSTDWEEFEKNVRDSAFERWLNDQDQIPKELKAV